MKKIFILVIVVLTLGCAAAGVPHTNDPEKRLEFAYQLMNTPGRGIAAERLGLQSLSEFEAAGNVYGEAEAHTFLGLFYKSSAYREHKDFYVSHGEYDPTSEKSISHFKEAEKAFEKDGDYWGVSKVIFAMGNAFASEKDMKNACSSYKESLDIYRSDKNVFIGRVHPHNPNFGSYEEMVESFIQLQCGGV